MFRSSSHIPCTHTRIKFLARPDSQFVFFFIQTRNPPTMEKNEMKTTSPSAVEDSEEEENDILEESPCGRWHKRREEVRF